MLYVICFPFLVHTLTATSLNYYVSDTFLKCPLFSPTNKSNREKRAQPDHISPNITAPTLKRTCSVVKINMPSCEPGLSQASCICYM